MAIFANLDLDFCLRLTLTLVHFLWQGAAVALLFLAADFASRRAGAAMRYWLSAAALMAMALCPPMTFLTLAPPAYSPQVAMAPGVPLLPSAQNAARNNAVPSQILAPSPTWPAVAPPPEATVSPRAPSLVERLSRILSSEGCRRAAPWVAAAYLAGLVVMLARLFLALRGGLSLRKNAEPVTESWLLGSLERAAAAIGLCAAPAAAWCGRVAVPTVVGVLKPTVLLPPSLSTGLPPEHVEMLLLHELAHLRRYDHWVNLAQWVIETALFFHPAVWWLSRRIRTERELACDDLALAAGAAEAVYADSLLRMAELSRAALASEPAAALALRSHDRRFSGFGRRVLRLIEGGQPRKDLRLGRGWPVFILLAFVLIAGGAVWVAVNQWERLHAPPEGLLLEADRIVAQSDNGQRMLVAEGETLLRIEASAIEAEPLPEGKTRVSPKGSEANPVKVGVLLTGGEFNVERFEHIHAIAAERPDVQASYIVQKAWDRGLVEIPAAVVVPRAMIESRAWKKFKRRWQVREVDYVDPQMREYTAHAQSWRTGPDGETIPNMLRLTRRRSDGTKEAVTQFGFRFDPQMFAFFEPDGETTIVDVTILGRESNAHVAMARWQDPMEDYHEYRVNERGVIYFEWDGELDENGRFSAVKLLRGKTECQDASFEVDPTRVLQDLESPWGGRSGAEFPDSQFVIYNGSHGSGSGLRAAFGPRDGQAKCGWTGKVSEVTWKYLGRQDGGWEFEFTRRFPADVPADRPELTSTSVRRVVYGGGTLEVFSDDDQWIGIELASPSSSEATATARHAQVTDTAGNPIQGAMISASVYRPRDGQPVPAGEYSATTDEEGRFPLPPLMPGDRASVSVNADGFLPITPESQLMAQLQLMFERDQDGSYPDNPEIVLQRPGVLEGTVLGPDGRPLAGAPLSLTTHRDRGGLEGNALRAVTDEQGRWRMTDVPPGTHLVYYIWAGPSNVEVREGTWDRFKKPGESYPSAPVKGVCGAAIVEVAEGATVQDVNMDLSRSTARVEGRVTGAEGRPIEGASVHLYWNWERTNARWRAPVNSRGCPPVVTDAEGHFLLANLPPGRWGLVASHEQYESALLDLVLVDLQPDHTTVQDLVLTGHRAPAQPDVPAPGGPSPGWTALVQTIANESLPETIDNLTDDGDFQRASTSGGWLIAPGHGDFMAWCVPRLTRVRKLLLLAQSNSESVSAPLRAKLQQAMNETDSLRAALAEKGDTFAPELVGELVNWQVCGAAAVYLLAEIGDHGTLPLLAELALDQFEPGFSAPNWAAPRIFVVYAMNLLIQDFPRDALSEEQVMALNAAIEAGRRLARPKAVGSITWTGLFGAPYPRPGLEGASPDPNAQASLTLRVWDLRMDGEGTREARRISKEQDREIFGVMDRFVRSLSSESE